MWRAHQDRQVRTSKSRWKWEVDWIVFLFLLISCLGFAILSHLFTFHSIVRMWCKAPFDFFFLHFFHQSAFANMFNWKAIAHLQQNSFHLSNTVVSPGTAHLIFHTFPSSRACVLSVSHTEWNTHRERQNWDQCLQVGGRAQLGTESWYAAHGASCWHPVWDADGLQFAG